MSVIGSALTSFAITIWLTTTLYPDESQKPQLALALSALMLSLAIPTVLVAPIAGAFADRHDRRRTMIIADLLAAQIALLTLVLMAARQLNLAGIVTLGALNAACSAFHSAAFDTSYSLLVPRERLPRANGMMQTIFSLSGIVAPGLAATLIALPALARQGRLPTLAAPLAGIQQGALLAIGIDVATFCASALVLLFVRIPSPRRTDLHDATTGRKKSLWADIREGLRYIQDRPAFLWLLGTFTVANFMAGAFVMQPLLVKFQLAADWRSRGMSFESAMALLATVGGVGGVLGGIGMSVWGGLRVRRVRGVLVPLVGAGLALAVFGSAHALFVAAAAACVAEGLVPVMNAHSQAIWQTQTPVELQGRVFSVRRLIAQASWPLSTVVMGVLSSRFDPGHIVTGLGLGLALWSIVALFNPWLTRVEDREWLEMEAARRGARRAARAAAGS